jgi:hypothetical protein
VGDAWLVCVVNHAMREQTEHTEPPPEMAPQSRGAPADKETSMLLPHPNNICQLTDDRRRDALREAEIQRLVWSATPNLRRPRTTEVVRVELAGLVERFRAWRHRQRIETLGDRLPSS